MAQFLLPGIGYIDETGSGQYLLPGYSYINETGAVATLIELTGPSSGIVGVLSSDFVVSLDGLPSSTVTVTPSDNGGGGTFTPASVNLTAGTPIATFKYTPAALAEVTRTISLSNNGSLIDPDDLSFLVIVSPEGDIDPDYDYDGQNVTITLDTINTPTSGLASLVAVGGGGTTQGPIALVLGSGTAFASFQNAPPGEYAVSIDLINAAGTNPATGGVNVVILGLSGGDDGSHRALVLTGSGYRYITDAELGDGLKPLVLYNKRLRKQQTTEGTPIVMVNGRVRLLGEEETLEI